MIVESSRFWLRESVSRPLETSPELHEAARKAEIRLQQAPAQEKLIMDYNKAQNLEEQESLLRWLKEAEAEVS